MKGNRYAVLSSFTASLGGLLFGFDTAVISGAEKTIQEVFSLNSFWHGFTIAIALIGTLAGAVLSGKPADFFGRKKLLLFIGILYTFSALGSALAQSWYGFLFYRFVGGLGVGASSVVAPMYIAEIAPARLRGRLGTSFQLNIVAGILISYFSNYLISQAVTNNAWRWMLGVESIPAIIFIALVIFIPESPRWLILKVRIKEAASILQNIHPLGFKQELQEIQESIQIKEGVPRERLFSRIFFMPIILAVLVALFNQMSGINAVMYYAPRIFEMVGYAQDSALLQSVSVGSTLFIFTIVGMFLIDKVGRKKLLLIGAAGMVFFLAMVAKTVFTTTDGSVWMLIYLSGFIAFFAFSQGTVIWVFISEIFPNSVRAKGQALGSFTHWASAAAISWIFPVLAGNHGGGWTFAFFSASMVVQFFVVWKFFPETKGKSLEQIQNEMTV